MGDLDNRPVREAMDMVSAANDRLPLFRAEAVAAQSASDYGAPISTMPMSWRFLTGFFFIFVVALVVFLSTQKYARKETADGVLSLSGGEIRVGSQKPGTVTAVFVAEGQHVSAGDALAQVSTEEDLVGGGRAAAETLTAIEKEKMALHERLASLDRAAPLEKAGVAQRLDFERSKLTEMDASMPMRDTRLALAKSTFEEAKLFYEKGVISGDIFRQRQYDFLSQAGDMQSFRAQLRELEGTIAQDQLALSRQPFDTLQTRDGLLNDIAALEERGANARALGGYIISAKIAGRITALQAKAGQLTDGVRPLMTLVPTDSELQGEIYVPSRAIGFARIGQKVRLLYEAFPYQQFGAAYGTVQEISTTVLKPDEIGAAIESKVPVYRVMVRLTRKHMLAYGRELPLRAGMAFTADLVQDEQSFLSILLDPLIAARGRLLAE